ncbi:protein kinase domain-containing protein [Citrus sinensis]|uniref:Protein kinase domain-containing protein n=1 Tax=Citrus sinensis TaxID=2711 RepID=A0ACB8L952_CITSI|nr:protein kinase domain-containing protein [Citrus sinensis]
MLKTVEEPKTDLDGSALVAHGNEQKEIDEEANKVHGVIIVGNHAIHEKAIGNSMENLQNWKTKSGDDARLAGLTHAFHASTTNPEQQSSSESIPFTQEQMEHLYKMLQSQSVGNSSSSCSLAQLGKAIVGCKWVFTVKYNYDGSLEQYKARLVPKGYTQTYGVDYFESFSPVTKLNIVGVLLSVAANLDWSLNKLYVKNAFLNGDLEEEVYMEAPPGFTEKFGSKVCRLKRLILYGLKQSPRAWFERFTKFVKSQGYSQGQADHTFFIKAFTKDKLSILTVYVDDIILTGDDTEEMSILKQCLAKEFEIKDLGQLRYFLGMEVARSTKGIMVSQRKYTLDLLKKTGMSGCKPADTPINPNVKLGEMKRGVHVDTGRYQGLVGKLIYLSHTRPDITFAVSMRGIEVYTDADWAGSITDRRSTSEYYTFLWGNLVTWRIKTQSVVARGSVEAEFHSMA